MESTDSKMVLALHPLCTLFPRLEGAEFEALKADIVANGQREPITVHDGLVLDGGNRYRACVEAGIEPMLKDFTSADPVAFVLSANLHRRHLTPGQQAAIVATAQDWAGAQAVGRPEKSGNVAGLDTVADRAGQSGASERTQRMADKVARQSPELARRVAHGEISLPQALEQLAPKAEERTARAPAAAGAATPLSISPTDTTTAAPAPATAAPAPAAPPSLVQQVIDQQADTGDVQGQDAGHEDETDPFEQLNLDYCTLLGQCAALQADKAELERRIALLTGDDLAAQVDALALKCAQFDSLATSRFNDLADRDKTIRDQRSFIEGLRRAANLPKDGDLVAWIKNAARRAA